MAVSSPASVPLRETATSSPLNRAGVVTVFTHAYRSPQIYTVVLRKNKVTLVKTCVLVEILMILLSEDTDNMAVKSTESDSMKENKKGKLNRKNCFLCKEGLI